jgi:hypothetical protein
MTERIQPLTREELKQRYGAFYRVSIKAPLDPAHVPPALHPLIPYVEIWSTSDDQTREEMFDVAPKVALEDLQRIADDHFDEIDAWLGGPESESPKVSREYVAFTDLRIAREYLAARYDV